MRPRVRRERSRSSPAAVPSGAGATSPVADFDAIWRSGSPRPTTSTPRPPAGPDRRRAPGPAAGARRAALDQAVLLLRRRRRGWTATPASRRRRPSAKRGRNREWRHFNAADIMSMPDAWEYPWFAAWDLAFHCMPFALIDPDFAKEQLHPARAGVVPAPERPDPGLRVGVRRRQPAGARLGRLARLQDRAAAQRRGRPRLPGAGLPQAAAELHLVGQPQGQRGEQRLRGRLPRARQHRRLRPQRAAADRRPHRAERRHQLDGHVLPEHADDRAGAGRRRTAPTRTSPPSSSSTSSTSPAR